MSTHARFAACAGILCTSLAARAGVIQFSFAPPTTGNAITSIAGAAGPNVGLVVFDQASILNFVVDTTADGGGIFNFPNARMVMSLALPPATDLGGGLFRSAVTGSFTIYDFTDNIRNDILTATLAGGQFLKFDTSHVILLNSNSGLTYSAGPRLNTILAPGRTLASAQDGTFPLANVRTITGSSQILGPGNVFETFFARSGFTGSTNTIPNPGALALAAMGALLIARRRR